MIKGFWRKRAIERAFRMATAARDAGDWAGAAEHYRRYLAYRAGDFAIWVQLGHMFAESNDPEQADRAYRIAYGLNPSDADLALCRGHLASRTGERDLAIGYYRESFALDGNQHAANALDALLSPEPDPLPEVQPASSGGVIEGWFERTVTGQVYSNGCSERPWVEFHAGGRVVGRSPVEAAEDGRLTFRTLLDADVEQAGQSIQVSAYRMPDGAALESSPINLFPPSRNPAGYPVAWAVPSEIVKAFTPATDDEVVLFVTHSRSGKIKPHVTPYIRALRKEGLRVVLIATVDRAVDLPDDLIDLADGLVVRRNAGYDFAAWAHTLKLFPELYGVSTLYLANDSVIAATGDQRIARLVDRVRNSSADLIGLTESHEWRWHVQSYFLAIKAPLLASRSFFGFMDDVRLLRDKDDVIRAYEVCLAELADGAGHRVEVLFPSATAINPVLFGWRRLVDDGLPFVKLLLLRGEFAELDVDIEDWQGFLAAQGFDVELAEATLVAAAESGPIDDGGRLVARRRVPAKLVDAPLKVDFFGPWNYDNGLGQASRGIIAALRRTGVRLNLHPIKQPFHVHRPLVPPADVIDFHGRADVAIVHLNPDSWHLLTDWQRGAVAAATRRIGYWVWEMGHLPTAWRRNFGAVDRIWAPSRYCAQLFESQGDAPVDVIPHVVPVLPAVPLDRPPALAALDLPLDRRVILYVFDGSSYLVRKNPGALVRAFSASGLGERGWTLVLKTKHLQDRPEEGAAFRTLAQTTGHCVLIDRAMPAADLENLMQLADIYASPHCSEGFGLTIAEAMAAGKAVVATDYSGSRDYLDVETGWPVKAHPWTLGQDFGHYAQGGEWARIDEPALTAALLDAAAAIEAGDSLRPTAARARIAERMSYQAVADRISASLAAIGDDREVRGEPFIATDLSAGTPIEHAPLSANLKTIVLAEDGTIKDALPDDLPDDRDSWILFGPHRSVLSPFLERDLREHAAARPDAGIFYGDDFAAGEDLAREQLRLKPEFDITLLAAQDYIGAPLIVRASAFAQLGLRTEMGAAVLDDLLLRAHHQGISVVRIPSVLLAHRGYRPIVPRSVRLAMLADHHQYSAYQVREGSLPTTLALLRRFEPGAFPPVTLIIPTRRSVLPGGTTAYVERLLNAIAEVDWPMDRLSVLIGDDIAGTPNWETRNWPFALRRIETPRPPDEPFNYAAKMNCLWREADTEQIVFLNDDLLPIGAGWLRVLVGFAMDESVGGVGARLLYDDGRLQHAGIAPLFGAVAHVWAGRRRTAGTYQDWALVQREWSMLTGAVFATRRSLMERIAGFDEQFTLEFNDVDLCLRLRALGYRIVYTPEAELVHSEKASRGDTPPSGDQYALFHQRWASWLNQDPAWHPSLRRDSFETVPADDPGAWYR